MAVATLLAGCGGSTSFRNAQISGVAAQGIPVVGAQVTLTDATGKTTLSSATGADGSYSLQVSGTAPFVLTIPATDTDGSPTVLSAVIVGGGTVLPGSVTANLNPLTSLITQRVLGVSLTGAPSAAQIQAAGVSQNGITQAETQVAGVLQPLFTALNVPASMTTDPIGAAGYQANASNPLDALFDVAHFTVHTNTIDIGNGTGGSNTGTHASIQIPLTGTMPSAVAAGAAQAAQTLASGPTNTPIQHLIVVIGENQTLDGLFGGYAPPTGQTIRNLLSEGIITATGTPGANFSLAQQNQAGTQTAFALNPARTTGYATLPQPLMTGMLDLAPLLAGSLSTPFAGGVADPSFPANLPNGPFQISTYTNGYASLSDAAVTALAGGNTTAAAGLSQLYGLLGIYAMTGDPVHRFFQMWQQTGGDNSKFDLYTWVATTTGQGGDTVSNEGSTIQITPASAAQGGELMGFMNMSAGDAPYLQSLAQQYTLSDNYHQAILGGTGMNFFAIATGDLPWFNTSGAITAPPANQIENPNPMAGSANFYTADGYQGGSYVNCSDSTQPGVSTILGFLATKNVASNCDAGKYYLVNNYDPGYDQNGNLQPIGPNNYNYPPQTVPTIAESLAAKGISWGWYTAARDTTDVTATANTLAAVLATKPATTACSAANLTGSALTACVNSAVSAEAKTVAAALQAAEYNSIGDPLVGSQNVMTSALKGNLADYTAFLTAVATQNLPAVSFVVPPNLSSGHPGYSTPAAYEAFLKQLITAVQASPQYANTAILVTTDEGGGHFDTGPIQPLDFFGDGPRIPMLVISPYARQGVVDHTYNDHGSILKFIERNWRLQPLSARSRDRLPNPSMAAGSYVPVNSTPAIGDLMTMFSF